MSINKMTGLSQEEMRLRKIENFNSLLQELSKSTARVISNFKNVPKTVQVLYLKVFTGKTSMSNHIKLKCLDCCCWDKEEVRLCTTVTCPLHKIRPYKK